MQLIKYLNLIAIKSINIKMTYRALNYSLKVWLTSVLIAPIMLFMFLVIETYLQPSTHGLTYSNTGWYLTFWGFVEVSIIFNITPLLRKLLIFLIGVSLSIGTSALLQSPFIIDDFFFVAMICNTICIGLGCWLYKF